MRSTFFSRLAVLAVGMATLMSSWPAPASATNPAAEADDPVFVGWTALMPALTYQYEPTSLDDCVAGRLRCVDQTIREMERRYQPLARACSHQAVFALAYLRTTEGYRRFSLMDGFLSDRTFVNHQDVAFAEMYFDAYDDWAAGRLDRVPPAWRIALDAADRSTVSGSGNLLLGINAHVNRDLPFVLAGIGLTKPDGTSRKPDHNQINKMLNNVMPPLVAEEAATFDPSIRTTSTPFGIGYTGLMQTLLTWREVGWRFAEQLVSAPTAADRDRVAAEIERYAASTALAIVAATSYRPPLTSPAERDEFCAAS